MPLFDDWYDYINPLEYLTYGKQELFDKPANQVKQAYEDAMNRSRTSGRETRDFLLDREERAQGMFKPLEHLFQNAYGTEGIAGPVHPGVPGSMPLPPQDPNMPPLPGPPRKPLGKMYGGGR